MSKPQNHKRIDQFRYIKIQPNIIDLSMRLWIITTQFVGFIPKSLVLRSNVLGWILIYRNWSITIVVCCFLRFSEFHIKSTQTLFISVYLTFCITKKELMNWNKASCFLDWWVFPFSLLSEDHTWDWFQHDKHSRQSSFVHCFISLTVNVEIKCKIIFTKKNIWDRGTWGDCHSK